MRAFCAAHLRHALGGLLDDLLHVLHHIADVEHLAHVPREAQRRVRRVQVVPRRERIRVRQRRDEHLDADEELLGAGEQ